MISLCCLYRPVYSSSFKSMLIKLMKFRIFNQWLVATSSSAGHYSLSLICPNVNDFPCQSCSGCRSLGPCCLMADWNLRTNCFHFSQVEEARETREGTEGKGVPGVSSSRVSISVTFLSSGRGAGDARRHGRKRASSRVFCCHYFLPKRKRRGRRAKAWKEKESHASLPGASFVSISF